MSQSEDSIHKSVIQWFSFAHRGLGVNFPNLLFTIPNGVRSNPIVGAQMKAKGLRPGVPDLFLAVQRGGYGGLFIELKTLKGRPSEIQKAFHALLIAQGYEVAIPQGWEAATRAITAYLKLPDAIKGAA